MQKINNNTLEFLYSDKDFNQRIDIYLCNNSDLSRNYIQNLIKKNNVLVNGLNVKSSYLLQNNDKIIINFPQEKEFVLKPEALPLEILYEDNDLAIINKEAGLVVHPSPTYKKITLVQVLLHHFKKLSTIDAIRPGIVHRLDKFSEGIMIIAKNNPCHEKLKEMFQARQIKKKYYAVVKGMLTKDDFEINAPIGRHPKNRKKYAVIKEPGKGKDAITFIRILAKKNNYTSLEIHPKTGRTHQIRVHLAHLGHPILGDPTYAKKSKSNTGQLLQAFALEFIHPITNKFMKFEIPVSERLKKYFLINT
ncbi:RluA family pseudouridine synthase [Candidatus Margulisiibacteriota bacterium]